jgi:hypothetical protein
MLEAAGVPPDRFFVIPGNHDVQQGEAKNAWNRLRDLGDKDAGTLSNLMAGVKGSGAQQGWRDQIPARTAAFWKWVKTDLNRAELNPAENPHGRLGYRRIIPPSRLPFPIHVIGLDSAWLAGDKHDARKLHLTRGQVDLLTLGGGAPLSGFRLALVHHPLDHLADAADCYRLLSSTVDLLLHGHQHDPIAEQREDPDRALRVLAAGSLFEGDAGEQWPNSFHLVEAHLDAEGKALRYEITFWGWSPKSEDWYETGAIYRAAKKNGRMTWWTPHGRQTLQSAAGWAALLNAFLASTFNVKVLRMWVQCDVSSLEPALPRAEQPIDSARLAAAIASQIERDGLASDALFDSLSDLCEASQKHEVESIRKMWKQAGTGGAVPDRMIAAPGGSEGVYRRAAAGTAPKTHAAPRAAKDEAAHTSIVLDRLLQWDTLVQRLGESRNHIAFLVHGAIEQDLHLFMRRIRSYLNPQLHKARKSLHHVLEVERMWDTTEASTTEDWQYSLVRGTRTRTGTLEFVLAEETRDGPVLFVFSENGHPLRGLDETSTQGLIELLISGIDTTLAKLDRQKKKKKQIINPVRLVIPIEHPPSGIDPAVQKLAGALGQAEAIALEHLPELHFPPWTEVLDYIKKKYQDAGDDIIGSCHAIHARVFASPDRTLQQLGDELDRVLNQWRRGKYYT